MWAPGAGAKVSHPHEGRRGRLELAEEEMWEDAGGITLDILKGCPICKLGMGQHLPVTFRKTTRKLVLYLGP